MREVYKNVVFFFNYKLLIFKMNFKINEFFLFSNELYGHTKAFYSLISNYYRVI